MKKETFEQYQDPSDYIDLVGSNKWNSAHTTDYGDIVLVADKPEIQSVNEGGVVDMVDKEQKILEEQPIREGAHIDRWPKGKNDRSMKKFESPEQIAKQKEISKARNMAFSRKVA